MGALDGLRVLNLGTQIAGPFCSALLADHGADVVKVERPGQGDPARTLPPMIDGVSLWWKVMARNQRLITLNLAHPSGQDLARELARNVDIVVENFRPGTLERWGLGYDDLDRVRPGIILVRISGYGQTGPYSQRPGYGTVAEAMSGIPAFTGMPDHPPQLSAFPLADTVAATFGALGALAAVFHRYSTGKGQVVDVSLFEPLFRLVESQVIAYDQLGIIKKRRGNRLEENAPRNAYETRDGEYVAVSVLSPRSWERFTRAIGREELIDDSRFIDNVRRCENAEALDEIIARWHKERNLSDVLHIFEENDVVAGPVYDIARIFSDEQYRAREAIIEVQDPRLGVIRMQNVAPRLTLTPGGVRHPGLELGFHNNDVYIDELGMTPARFAELSASGII